MKFFKGYNIERNFPRGVYLSPLGEIPSLAIARESVYSGELFIPVLSTSDKLAVLKVSDGKKVAAGDLLAEGFSLVKSPCSGTVCSISSCNVYRFGECKAICIKPDSEYRPWVFDGHGSNSFLPSQTRPQKILAVIEQAGVVCLNGILLADVLREQLKKATKVIIANAVAPEPDINTPAAILSVFPAQVYTGVAILRHLLGAGSAMLAYPHEMEPDQESAEIWDVELVPVSEKYPQFYPRALASTLVRQGRITKDNASKLAVFDIQTLALVERAVMAGRNAVERIVTVAGDAVSNPGHYIVPVGLPVSDLLAMAGVESCNCVVAGRSLTGIAVDPARTVVSSCCESFTVLNEMPGNSPDRCNRCGRCIEYCPACLDPIRLNDLIEVGNFNKAQEFGLFNCYECGLCSYCCSSGLKILENIRMAKRVLNENR